ncbi:MAG TPA: ADOP family duplicated permease [Longimicrobiales bacterium]|nr:ADOP family duplicated permease [Longimicrobiales bacterium]
MSGFEGIRRVFRLGIGGGDADREVERELAHHFESTLEELRSRGYGEAEARAEARRRFGDERRYGRELRRLARGRDRRARGAEALSGVGRTVRDAGRSLGRTPAVSLAVVAIMALGVGANAAMFGVLDRLFLRPPLHVEAPDEVRRVFVHVQRSTTGEVEAQTYHPYPDYQDWAGLEVFASTAAYYAGELTAGHGEGAERIPVTLATASFFPTVGVAPVLGRFFDEADDHFGAEPVAVLGHAYWRSRYGGRADALGEVIDVGDESYTVIGVAPPAFTGVELERVDVWLPLHRAGMVEEGGTEWVDSRNWYWLQAVARLAPGVAPAAAEAAATMAHRRARAETPRYDPEARVELASLLLARTGEATREARVVPWLMGVAVMVLLLTCANVANLLLARGMRRRRETAVRLALGMSRRRVVGTVVAESVVLALLGGAAAVVVAVWGGDIFRSLLLPDIGWENRSDGLRVAVFSGGIALAAGVLAGFVPALRSGRNGTAEALKASGRSVTRGRSRVRGALLVFQAAVSVVLLVGTGLFVFSLKAARGVDLGFDAAAVLLVRLEPEGGYPGGDVMTTLYREGRRALAGVPGVESTAITTTIPFQNSRSIGEDLRVPGLDSLPRTRAGGAYIHTVTGDFFETAGLRIVRGRGLTDGDDNESAPRVAVVNRTMAELVWPDGDALGGCLIVADAPCATVVGIVEDHHRFALEEDESMHYYLPLARAPFPWPPRGIMVRARSPEALAAAVRERLRAELPSVRLVSARPYREVLDPQYRSWELGASLFGAFGVLALLVASLGLYSVLAFEVAERRPEMGVRAALGATRTRIVAFVMADGLRLAGLGVALGLLAAVLGAGWTESLLFGVSPRDPRVLAGVAILALGVSAAASGLPAWRATRVDPNEVLRAE